MEGNESLFDLTFQNWLKYKGGNLSLKIKPTLILLSFVDYDLLKCVGEENQFFSTQKYSGELVSFKYFIFRSSRDVSVEYLQLFKNGNVFETYLETRTSFSAIFLSSENSIMLRRSILLISMNYSNLMWWDFEQRKLNVHLVLPHFSYAAISYDIVRIYTLIKIVAMQSVYESLVAIAWIVAKRIVKFWFSWH